MLRLLLPLLFLAVALAQGEVPEHRLEGDPRPWVEAAWELVQNPKRFPANQVATLPPGTPHAGMRVYEYVNLKLGDRTFETVILAVREGEEGEDFVLELTPGAKGKPIAPEELGDVLLIGQGPNYWVFRILEGPFKGHFLVWSTATGHRGAGGEAIRIYAPKTLRRERGFSLVG